MNMPFATEKQILFIEDLCKQLKTEFINLDELDGLGVDPNCSEPEDLSVGEASDLIEELLEFRYSRSRR